MSRDLLLELGTEEIPAAEVSSVLVAWPELVASRLGEARLAHGAITVWGTPRRVALRVEGVAERQPDLEETLTGPPEQVAFREGKPTQAAQKFAEKVGVALDALEIRETEKGRYLVGRRVVRGQAADQVLPPLCLGLITGLGFRKAMRWADHPERFVRPLRWLVALFGEEVLEVTYAGVKAGRETRGHRFQSPGPVAIQRPTEYEAVLRQARVLPQVDERRATIERQIRALEKEHGATIIPDAALLDEVTNLVEWPTCVCGSFDEAFLAVPREVIISAMRGHQRYFAMERDGQLVNRFVTVLGTEVNDVAIAVRGNERVLAARLADARFFWEADLKVGLEAAAAELGSVVFQAQLGTMAEKVERVTRLGQGLAPRFGAEAEVVARAAALCKADLVTHMVGEFPDLQGIMGRYYAQAAGHPNAVADAILEHYQPRGASDDLPPSPGGAALAVADRLDTLVGCIGAGLKPKGGGDPFGLRRAALGVLRILLARGIRGSLTELAKAALASHSRVTVDPEEVVGFMLERLRGLLAETAPGEIVQAVMTAGGDDPLDLAERVSAVRDFGQTEEYTALATTFRRMNILKQADVTIGDVAPDKLQERAEQGLWTALVEARREVAERLAERQYGEALQIMAGLRPPVDLFFDEVKVMADEAALRANRLALVAAVDRFFRRVADFKMIAG